MHVGTLFDGGGDLHRVGHAWDASGVDEGHALDLVQAGVGQGLAEAYLVGGGDGAGLDLEALAGAFLMDRNAFGEIGHGFLLCPVAA